MSRPRHTNQLFDFWAWKKDIAHGDPKPLMKALIDSRRSTATNPRDHIYALMDITSGASSLISFPNYKLTTEEVYTDLATSMIRANGHLDIICLQSNSGRSNLNMPTWVPDWSNLSEINRPQQFEAALKNTGKYKDAVARGVAMAHKSFDICIADNVLFVSGRFYGMVDGLSTGMQDTDTTSGEIVQADVKTTAYGGGAHHSEALQDTLCMLLPDSTNPPDSPNADLLNCLLRPKGLEVMDSHAMLANWLVANYEMQFCGVRLGFWTQKFYANTFQWKKRLTYHLSAKADFTARACTRT